VVVVVVVDVDVVDVVNVVEVDVEVFVVDVGAELKGALAVSLDWDCVTVVLIIYTFSTQILKLIIFTAGIATVDSRMVLM